MLRSSPFTASSPTVATLTGVLVMAARKTALTQMVGLFASEKEDYGCGHDFFSDSQTPAAEAPISDSVANRLRARLTCFAFICRSSIFLHPKRSVPSTQPALTPVRDAG